MSHLQGKTYSFFFSRDVWKRKRTSAKVRGISNDANQEGKEEKKNGTRSHTVLFPPFHLDQDGR
jgi:hypothetical protein